MTTRVFAHFFCLCAAPLLQAQSVLTLDEALRRALAHHPIAQQAALLTQAAAAETLKAKGGFDPKLFGDHAGKVFKEKNYYALSEYGAKLPTGLGLEWKAGYATASGNFLNPQATLPSAGQAILGFDWTLGRGLLMDERRAELRQAIIGQRIAEWDKRLILNDLTFATTKAYWSWAVAETQASIYQQALGKATERLAAIRESWRQGDKAAVDTLEAYLLVQSRQMDLSEATLATQSARFDLDFFLGNADAARANWLPPAFAAPPAAPVVQVDSLEKIMLATHPALLAGREKLAQLSIERHLKRENLKPQLDVSYNLLGSGWQFFPGASGGDAAGFVANNAKFGANFSWPIPNRKARGEVQKADVKLAQAHAALEQKAAEQANKLRVYAAESAAAATQTQLLGSMAEGCRRLLEAEQAKFEIGESSVFMLNSREQKLLDAQIKWAKSIGALEKSRAGMSWALGIGAE